MDESATARKLWEKQELGADDEDVGQSVKRARIQTCEMCGIGADKDSGHSHPNNSQRHLPLTGALRWLITIIAAKFAEP